MSISYTSYLKIDELLELQQLESNPPEHDEMLFIIIHQTYELWFKQVLHEFGKLRQDMHDANSWGSIKTLRRVLTILKTMVSQIDILETMTPLEFNSFRDFLGQSSGFQSRQFRELEIICGLRSPLMIESHKDIPAHVEKLRKRMTEKTLWESFGEYLTKKGYKLNIQRENERGLLYNPSEENQKVLVKVMKNEPEVAVICELFIDFDEGLQEWRYRHVKMVERTIGTKMGTGGSDGAKYLHKTLNQAIFPDLWGIRSQF